MKQQVAASSEALKQNSLLKQKYHELETKIAATCTVAPLSHPRSTEHPDPEIFSADTPELRRELAIFVRKINMKFLANGDWCCNY